MRIVASETHNLLLEEVPLFLVPGCYQLIAFGKYLVPKFAELLKGHGRYDVELWPVPIAEPVACLAGQYMVGVVPTPSFRDLV